MTQQDPPTPTFDDVPPLPPQEGEAPDFPIPPHPDYELILGILEAGFDESRVVTQEGEAHLDINAWIRNYVDPQAISTVALQRTSGAFNFESPEQAEVAMQIVLKMSMLYTEAFIAGVKYGWMNPPEEA